MARDRRPNAARARQRTPGRRADKVGPRLLEPLPARPNDAMLRRVTSLAIDDAERKLAQLPRTFFSSEAAAEQLGMSIDDTCALLVKMQAESLALRVCRDNWVLTWPSSNGRRDAPVFTAYLDDMMRHLGVGHYLSYAAAAEMRGAAHHGVMQQRVNVETYDLDALELRNGYGQRDSAVRFHQINPRHGRPVAIMGTLCRPPASNGHASKTERRNARVATAETTLLDMIEHPDRCGGLDHVAEVALEMLSERLLHPKLLAEAAGHYALPVVQRTGSMLRQLRDFRHRVNLRPLMRHVRSRNAGPPVELHVGAADCCGETDRWGVTYARRLDYGPPNSLPWWISGRQAAPPWLQRRLQRLNTRRVPTSKRAMRPLGRCRSHASPTSARGTRIKTARSAGFGTTAPGW